MVAFVRMAFCSLVLLCEGPAFDPFSFPESMQADVRPIASAFRQHPNDPCVLYEVAAFHAKAGHVLPALVALRAMAATHAGLQPRPRDGFSGLLGNSEYEAIAAQIRRENPPVLSARPAFAVAEGDLVPEGIAYSEKTKLLYLGSIKRKIVSFRLTGEAEPLVAPEAGGLGTVVGIRVDDARGEIWAISNSIGPKPKNAVIGVFRFGLSDGKLVRSYPIPNGVEDFLNDLVVGPDGEVYVTATNAGTVLRVDPASGAITRFASGLPDPNGIAISPDGRYLFVAGWYCITRIDRGTGAKVPLMKPANVADGCFDGLYWGGDRSLVGVQNCVHETGRIMRLRLSEDLTAITRSEVLESYNPAFDGLTTAAVAGDHLFFVANTQFRRLGKGEAYDPLTILDLPLR